MLQSGSRRVRERSALALAGSLHLAALVGLAAWAINREQPIASIPPMVAALDRTAEVDVEYEFDLIEPSALLTLASAAANEPAAARSAAAATGARTQGSPVRTHARSPRIDSSENGAPLPAENADLSANTEVASQNERNVEKVDVGLGPDAWQRWIGSTKDAPTRESVAHDSDRRPLFRAPRKSTTGGLQEGLEAHDRAVGLGPSGPVVSALYNAAHTTAAPELGVARFQVTVLKTGSVEISLSEASGNLDGWRAVATQAAEVLRRSPPRIPTGRAGMRLTVELKAEETMPNGLRTKALHGPRLQVDPVRFRSTQEAQAELKDRNPVAGENKELAAGTRANVDLPGIYIAGQGKVCSYRIGLSAFGLPLLDGGCDPSNIGAKPVRMVRTVVREEALF